MCKRQWKQKATSYLCIFLIFLTGCAVSAPNFVEQDISGDENRSCNIPVGEMASNNQQVINKDKKKRGKDMWNVIFFISGLVPFIYH